MSIDGIPEIVRKNALVSGAAAWLDHLPALVADLEREWSIVVGRPYPGGTKAFVAEVTRDDGTPAVLKLVIPRLDSSARNEISVLRLANGEGCARLLRDDVARGALLVERLGPSLHELALPIARRRISAHDDERAVLVHGDVHQWNALQANDGFKLVDPDGLLAEAEYEMGILMREDPADLLDGGARERAVALAERTRLDATAIWEWGVVERMSTGLSCLQIDIQPSAREMLAVAEREVPPGLRGSG
jgi:streptomycin 6-kinase